MPGFSSPVDIPNRTLFKPAEVCELLDVQPYVLRSWEAEFPELGISRSAGGPRMYRRSDVEQVVRIKHLLLVEGLTLAGVRRRLEEEGAPVGADVPLDQLIGENARERLTAVKQGLRSILDLLSYDSEGIGASDPAPLSEPRSRRRGAVAKASGRKRGLVRQVGSTRAKRRD
jgi:DNA-binding transcriptional MerR regulator